MKLLSCHNRHTMCVTTKFSLKNLFKYYYIYAHAKFDFLDSYGLARRVITIILA